MCIAYEPVENNLNINSNINSKAMHVYAYTFFAKKKKNSQSRLPVEEGKGGLDVGCRVGGTGGGG